MAPAAMLRVRWMYGDAGKDFLGHSVARRNSLRWSRSLGLEEAVATLGKLRNTARPIRLRVKNKLAEEGDQKRSLAKVEQVFGDARSAISALQSLVQCPENPNAPDFDNEGDMAPFVRAPSKNSSGSEYTGDGEESFFSLDSFIECPATGTLLSAKSTAEATLSGSPKQADGRTQQAPGSSPMAVLRAHLKNGSPVLAKWMWGDAGLTNLISQWTHLAESNPWRWSKPQTLPQAVDDLETHVVAGYERRPIRLQVWSYRDIEAPCVHFATTAANAASAGSILWEIHAMVCALDLEAISLCDTDSFKSFAAEALAAIGPSRSLSMISSDSSPPLQPKQPRQGHVHFQVRQKHPPTNTNRISQYRWLEELLQTIVEGSARDTARDLDKKQAATPLFVVAGACPNNFSGMQAVVYCHMQRGVDFWWAKPSTEDSGRLERNTLDLHSSGKFKNNAGKSRAVYAPLAEKFAGGRDGDFVFGVDDGGRAFIEDHGAGAGGHKQRMLIYFVWQESWSSLFARKKFLQGKIFYQLAEKGRGPATGEKARFFARQYRIEEGHLDIACKEDEEEVPAMWPPDHLQEMYDMTP